MNLKKILIISTIILLLSLTAVSAADLKDVNATNTIAHDTPLISTLENTNIEHINATSSTGTFDDLQVEINNAPTGSVLNLTRDYNGHYGSRIQLEKSLTIDGQGHTLNCLGEKGCSAFYSTSGNIILKNIKIINGHNDYYNCGGAIYIDHEAQYKIINCTFNNNWADSYGGAIYNGAISPIILVDCQFENNKADDNNGGAVYSKGDVYIQGCTFKSNTADMFGGAIYSKKNVIIENNTLHNTIFENNFAKCDGGAIWANFISINENCPSEPINTFFRKNKASQTLSTDTGGAIHSSEGGIIQNTCFKENEADLKGGAVYVDSENLIIKNCLFESNKVYRTDYSCEGGAVMVAGNLYINNCTFKNNKAKSYGGAIAARNIFINDNESSINPANTFFIDNYAENGGAVASVYDTHVTNAEFISNSAQTDGGAIYSENDVYSTHCLFDSNKAEGSLLFRCFGGAIHADRNTKISKCTFKKNYAENRGGAIHASTVTITDIHSSFDSNTAGDYGGAIYTEKFSNDDPYLSFTNNKAKEYSGGAIYAEKDVTLPYATFIKNSALISGGAVYCGGNVYVAYCCFESNEANGALSHQCLGGAVCAADDIKIKNCTFYKNYAENKGGAVYASTVTFTEDKSLFDSNTARDYGGAIYTDKFINNVNYKTFTNNKAQKDDGGAIYINKENWVTFTHCIFVNNQCGDEGGAIYLDSSGSHLTLKDNIFSKNSAKDGKAVFNCGYYDSIKYNFWAGKNPSSNNNELVEWKHWPEDNIYHSDSNPLEAKLMYDTSLKDHKVHITLYFKADPVIYSGEVYDLNKVSFEATPEIEIKDKKVTQRSVELDVLPEIGNIYTITANIYGYTTSIILDASKINITAPEITTYYNNSKEFKIHLDGDNYLVANQKMIVTLDSTNYEVFSDENGDASLYFNNYAMNPGTYEILISLGNISYKSALTIIPNITIIAPSIATYYGSSAKLKIHIDGDKRFACNQKVKISVLNCNYEVFTDENGDASLCLDYPNEIGTYNISIGVLNLKAQTTLEIKSTIEGENTIRSYGDYTPFPVTFKNSNGEYLPDCALVQYAIDDSMFMFINVHGNEGQALLGIGILNPGYHWIKVYNLETKELRYFEIDILPQLSSTLEKLDIGKYTSQILNQNAKNKMALSTVSENMESVNQNLNASTDLNQNWNAPVKHIGDENILASTLTIVLAICLIMGAGCGIYITKT